jgi:hypothetical protein
MHYLAEVVNDGDDLHIYINSDKFTTADNTLVASFDGEQLAYSIDLKQESDIEKGLDWFMGLLGRDTQNWFTKNIVIHWGVNTWRFYNAKNISVFDTDTIKDFDIKDYDVKKLEG